MWHLREVPHCVGTLNPHKEEGVELVLEMVRQVIALHPGLSAIHIGADEVRTYLLAWYSHLHGFKDAFLLCMRFTFWERGRNRNYGWLHLDIQWRNFSSVT